MVADAVVKQADVVVDLHGGDLDENLRPYSYWMRGGDATQDEASKALTLAFGLDHIMVWGYTTDYVGRRTGEIRTPVAGLVTFVRGVPSMWQGATLANVSPIFTTVPPYKKPSR